MGDIGAQRGVSLGLDFRLSHDLSFTTNSTTSFAGVMHEFCKKLF
jgi:hypothetical protein